MKEKLVKNLYPSRSIERIEKKYNLMGVDKKGDPYNFLLYRLIFCLIFFLLLLIFSSRGFITAPIFTILVYYLIEYLFLDKKIKERASILDYESLFYFQVLSLSLESGKDLKGAISLTCENISSTISKEFEKTIKEVEFGKSLTEALDDMKKRIPSESINSVILNINQSNVYGNNILESLNNQIEFIRNKKILEVKSTINKMPLKISILSVLFIIPIVLLIILGPLIIRLISYLY